MTELFMEGAIVLKAMGTLLFCCGQGVWHLPLLFVNSIFKTLTY